MSTLAFTGDMARLQQAIAESHDLVVRRGTVLEALNLRTSEQVLEVGCGGGYLTYEAARFVGPTGRVCAIDISPTRSRQRNSEAPSSAGSNAALRISHRRLTAMRSSMPFLPFKSSNI